MLRSTIAAPVSLLEKLPLCLNPVKFIQPLAGAPFQAAVAAPPTLVQQVKKALAPEVKQVDAEQDHDASPPHGSKQAGGLVDVKVDVVRKDWSVSEEPGKGPDAE